MRVLFALSLLFSVSVVSAEGKSQQKLTIKKSNISLREAFRWIEDQTELYFFFKEKSESLDRKVNIDYKDASLEQVLEGMLKNTSLTYKITDQYISIFPKKKKVSPPVKKEVLPAKKAVPQKKQIKGTVKDETGAPLVGVNVYDKASMENGVMTDINGEYVINVSGQNPLLVFSFIGYHAQEIRLGNRSRLDVTMAEDVTELDEIVVTALGIERDRKSLGYAISKVEGAALIEAGTPSNPIQSLYGKAAGVVIRQNAAGPMAGININIRGSAGLEASANTRPLFVVDGVPIFDENTSLTSGSDYGTGINDINSEDIASIEILKGGKASVLYGSRGANGVVLITTKNGSESKKKLSVDVSYQATIEEPRTFIEFQNKYGSGGNIYDVKDLEDGNSHPVANYSARSYGPAFNSEEQRIWWDGKARPYTARPDNYEFLFNTGHSKQINASVSGSGDYGHVRFSYTNLDYTGIQDENWMKKNTFSFASKFNLSDKFTIESSLNLYDVETHNRPQGMLKFFTDGISRGAPFDEFINNGDYLEDDPLSKNFGYPRDFEEEGWPTGYYSLQDFSNYKWSRNRNSALDHKKHLIANIRPTYHVTDWLSLTGQVSFDYTDTDFTTKNSVTRIDPEMRGGYYGLRRRNTQVREYKGFANFMKDFVDDRLEVFVMAGTSYQEVKENSVNVSTASVGSPTGFNYPNWYHINNQATTGWPGYNQRSKVMGNNFGENSMYSVFGVATLTWDDVYTLELNARNDWSSTLPPDNNSYFYPGVAFTYDATKVIKRVLPIIQFSKFRASWADVGRDAPSRYYANNTLSAGKIEGTDANSISAPNSLIAGYIKPERKREFEIGTEINFFKKNRIGLDFSYYTNTVYDQIMAVPLTRSTGANNIKINAGEVRNWGYEVQLKATPILTNDLVWNMTLTTSNQFSKIVKLYDGITEKNVNSMRGRVYVKAVEGERIGNIYGTGIARDDNGNRIVNADGSSYLLDEKDFEEIGNVNPDFIGGFNTNIMYKGLRLSAHFDYSYGATMYSETNQWLYYNGASEQSLEHRDQANGGLAYYYDQDKNAVPYNHDSPKGPNGEKVYHDGIILKGVVKNGDGTYSENEKIVPVSSYYGTFVSWANEAINAVDRKYKNNYIKVREIALSYRLPQKWVERAKLRNVTLNVFARNLGYIYKSVPNLDSEAYMGTNTYFEASAIPSTRTFGMKIQVGL
ncbi:SusC/RagA family TonB-linked outer membrane protein [Fulvitalea axinellae]